MANSIGLTYTELRRWIGREIGASRASADWSTATTTDVNDILKRALHRYYWPKLSDGSTHLWSWLQPKLAQIELHGPYTTGTVAVTSGVVTLSGGTFPTWAAQGDFYVGGYWATVNTRDSGTQVTLDDTTITGVTAGTTYELVHREYDLPSDFGGLVSPFSYRPDQTQWNCIETVNEAMIRANNVYPTLRGKPRFAAIVPTAPHTTEDAKQHAIFDPPPDSTIPLWFRHSIIPPMIDGSSGFVYSHGGAHYMDALLASCVDMALQTLYGDSSKHGDYQLAIHGAVELDKRLNRPDTFGFGSHSTGYDRGGFQSLRDHRRQATIGTLNLL